MRETCVETRLYDPRLTTTSRWNTTLAILFAQFPRKESDTTFNLYPSEMNRNGFLSAAQTQRPSKPGPQQQNSIEKNPLVCILNTNKNLHGQRYDACVTPPKNRNNR
eukprot:gene6643-4762_t